MPIVEYPPGWVGVPSQSKESVKTSWKCPWSTGWAAAGALATMPPTRASPHAATAARSN
jgi:hypothetical protein